MDKRDGADRTGLHQASWSGRTEVCYMYVRSDERRHVFVQLTETMEAKELLFLD